MKLMTYTKELEEAAENWSGEVGPPNKWSKQFPDGIRLYDNAIVENIFAKAHPITPGIWFGPPIVYGLYRGVTQGSVISTVLLFIVGWLLWTLAEYLLHRFPFHRAVKPGQKKLPLFLLHGYHHEFPSDPMRLVAPISASWTVGIVLWFFYLGVLGATLGWPLFAGTSAGYLAYDWVHYYTHHFRPKTRFGKFIRRYHMEHHFKDQTCHFGISSPLWDVVFGTLQSKLPANEHEKKQLESAS